MAQKQPTSNTWQVPDLPRICVTCRHLQLIGEGQAIAGLIDTTYSDFRCQRYGLETREMTHFPTLLGARLEINAPREGAECPGWESWQTEAAATESRSGAPASENQ